MRVMIVIAAVYIMINLSSCQQLSAGRSFEPHQCENARLGDTDYEIHAQSEVPFIDTMGIWENYMETETNFSGRLYFDDGKLKRWKQ
jgi:hypothetical protein